MHAFEFHSPLEGSRRAKGEARKRFGGGYNSEWQYTRFTPHHIGLRPMDSASVGLSPRKARPPQGGVKFSTLHLWTFSTPPDRGGFALSGRNRPYPNPGFGTERQMRGNARRTPARSGELLKTRSLQRAPLGAVEKPPQCGKTTVIPVSEPTGEGGFDTGMTNKGKGQSQAKRGFFNNPLWRPHPGAPNPRPE